MQYMHAVWKWACNPSFDHEMAGLRCSLKTKPGNIHLPAQNNGWLWCRPLLKSSFKEYFPTPGIHKDLYTIKRQSDEKNGIKVVLLATEGEMSYNKNSQILEPEFEIQGVFDLNG